MQTDGHAKDQKITYKKKQKQLASKSRKQLLVADRRVTLKIEGNAYDLKRGTKVWIL